MVHQETSQRKTVKNYLWLFLVLLGILTAALAMCLCLLVFSNDNNEGNTDEKPSAEDAAVIDIEPTTEEDAVPDKIDFQSVVDEWAQIVGGKKSVMIYDLDRDEIAAEYNPMARYNTASLYKLFVVYEGYRRIENGEWETDDAAGSTRHTILECLDLAIRESNSACAETMWANIGHDELDEIVKNDFNIVDTDVSALASTPPEIMQMMKLFYEHPDIKDEVLVARMKDSFLNQPITEYNWRQGLPSGFSGNVNVYNKVGWDYNAEEKYWNIYNDAAIVEFPDENRHFIVVVMTSKVPYQKIRNLGSMIESALR